MGLGLEEGIGCGGGFVIAFVGGAAIDVGGFFCDGLDGAAAGTGGGSKCGPGSHRFILGGLPWLSGGVFGSSCFGRFHRLAAHAGKGLTDRRAADFS